MIDLAAKKWSCLDKCTVQSTVNTVIPDAGKHLTSNLEVPSTLHPVNKLTAKAEKFLASVLTLLCLSAPYMLATKATSKIESVLSDK